MSSDDDPPYFQKNRILKHLRGYAKPGPAGNQCKPVQISGNQIPRLSRAGVDKGGLAGCQPASQPSQPASQQRSQPVSQPKCIFFVPPPSPRPPLGRPWAVPGRPRPPLAAPRPAPAAKLLYIITLSNCYIVISSSIPTINPLGI